MGTDPIRASPGGRKPGKEHPVRELNPAEILAVAGGLPPVYVLDEVSYRAPAEPLRDPVEYADLAAEDRRPRTPD